MRIVIPFGPLCSLVHHVGVMDEDPVLCCGFGPSNIPVQGLSIANIAAIKLSGPKCSSIVDNRPCLLALMESVPSPVLIVNGFESLAHD